MYTGDSKPPVKIHVRRTTTKSKNDDEVASSQIANCVEDMEMVKICAIGGQSWVILSSKSTSNSVDRMNNEDNGKEITRSRGEFPSVGDQTERESAVSLMNWAKYLATVVTISRQR